MTYLTAFVSFYFTVCVTLQQLEQLNHRTLFNYLQWLTPRACKSQITQYNLKILMFHQVFMVAILQKALCKILMESTLAQWEALLLHVSRVRCRWLLTFSESLHWFPPGSTASFHLTNKPVGGLYIINCL